MTAHSLVQRSTDAPKIGISERVKNQIEKGKERKGRMIHLIQCRKAREVFRALLIATAQGGIEGRTLNEIELEKINTEVSDFTRAIRARIIDIEPYLRGEIVRPSDLLRIRIKQCLWQILPVRRIRSNSPFVHSRGFA